MIQIDMEMPTSCEECPLGNKGNIAVGCKLSEYAWAYSWGKGKLPNCPLHEVTDPDTVSRQVVIDTVRKIILGFFSDKDGVMNDTEKTLLSVSKAICNGVMELPSTQSEPHWIPCSESLPDGKEYVLVTDYGETNIGRRFCGKWWLDYCGDKMKDVTAWMPLPEPYQVN